MFVIEIVPSAVINRSSNRALVGAAVAVLALAVTLVLVATPDRAAGLAREMVVLGATADHPDPSCPGLTRERGVNVEVLASCEAVGKMTGFQMTVPGEDGIYRVPFDGKIVSWSITLSKPSRKDTETERGEYTYSRTNEVRFFNTFFGKPSQARISVLRRVPDKRPAQYNLLRHSPIQRLNPYFGQTVEFALEHPLSVLEGQIVALTVPTWAPTFAINLSEENTWRASRASGDCTSRKDIKEGRPQQKVGSKREYGCAYTTARLIYTATVVQGNVRK